MRFSTIYWRKWGGRCGWRRRFAGFSYRWAHAAPKMRHYGGRRVFYDRRGLPVRYVWGDDGRRRREVASGVVVMSGAYARLHGTDGTWQHWSKVPDGWRVDVYEQHPTQPIALGPFIVTLALPPGGTPAALWASVSEAARKHRQQG